jgi:hypothetical protein
MHKTIRVLLDTGSSGDLLFLEKGSNKYIPVASRAVPESWSTSNGTFKTKKVSEVKLSFVEYSTSKKVHLCPDIVEYPRGGPPPLYDLIIGKQALHDIGAVLDFKERTITIDEILLPMIISTICSSNLAFPGHSSLIPALPRSQQLHVTPPNALWKSSMLSMTKQTFQAL